MVVRLRLSPHRIVPTAREHIFHIVACNAPRARDSAPLETVGVYDPYPKHVPVKTGAPSSLLDEGKTVETKFLKRVYWSKERLQHWIRVGAQPTKRVAWLMQKENLIPPGKVYHGFYGPKKPKAKGAIAEGATASAAKEAS